MHLLCDGQGVPLAVLVLPGQAHESKQFEEALNTVRIPQPRGRPRCRPNRLAADRAYSNQRIRHWLRQHHITAVIPPKQRRGRPKVGRPTTSKHEHYRGRNVVERCIGWLKECRSVCTRFEKLAINYLMMIKLAIIARYLRLL